MKILLFANTDWYLFNFRFSLIKKLRSAGHEVLCLSPPGDYGKRLEEAGFRWLSLPMVRGSLNPFHEFWTLVRLVRLYHRERPDIVHHFTVKCVILGGIAAVFAKVPATVNAIAGLGYIFANSSLKARALRPIVGGLLKWIIKQGNSCLIVQNKDDKDEIVQSGLTEKSRIFLIRGSGVDTNQYQPRHHADVQRETTSVLLAARLIAEKGIREYVEAARRLRAKGYSIRFLLAGEPDLGNPSAIRQSELDMWTNEGVVELLGQVEDMVTLYAETDIVVLPTYYREGVPRSLLEAAACGLPLITTNTPGCREIVIHGQTGLQVTERDAGALADAILTLHKNSKLAYKLGCQARKKVLVEFDEKIVLDQTLSVYRQMLKFEN